MFLNDRWSNYEYSRMKLHQSCSMDSVQVIELLPLKGIIKSLGKPP
jgi:hypothetical protein